MSTIYCCGPAAFRAALRELKAGDCVETERLASLAETPEELIAGLGELRERGGDLRSRTEGIDTLSRQGEAVFAVCRTLLELSKTGKHKRRRDGVEKAKEEGRYKGRKPIEVDEALFTAVVERWKNGEISARQAMGEVGLKPNTFYRRIKQQEEQKLRDYKKVQHALRSEIKAASKRNRQELDDLKKRVRAEAKEGKEGKKSPEKAPEPPSSPAEPEETEETRE